MAYHIEKGTGVPAYMQLYRALRHDITGGVIRCGEKLPSRRTLAGDTGTSVITVDHALELLLDEGYISARARSGYYCIYKGDGFTPADTDGYSAAVGDDAEETSDDERGHFWGPEELFPFPTLARTMRRVLTSYGERIMVKSPNAGVPELRKAIVSYLARSRGMTVRPEQVVIGSGSEYMYSLIVQMLGKDRLYGLEDPSYDKIRRVYEACGAATEMLPMGSHGIRSRALAAAKADVLHITPFHSYPSGVTADASKRHEYIRWALQRDAVIVEDDMDSEFSLSAKAEDTLFSLEPQRTVIYMNTFSRTIAPSIRSGYMVLPAERAADMREKIDFYSCTVPVFEQYVIAECLTDGDFERHISRVRRHIRQQSLA